MFQRKLDGVKNIRFDIGKPSDIIPTHVRYLRCTDALAVGRPRFFKSNIKIKASESDSSVNYVFRGAPIFDATAVDLLAMR
jgi:hypothetical protein